MRFSNLSQMKISDQNQTKIREVGFRLRLSHNRLLESSYILDFLGTKIFCTCKGVGFFHVSLWSLF